MYIIKLLLLDFYVQTINSLKQRIEYMERQNINMSHLWSLEGGRCYPSFNSYPMYPPPINPMMSSPRGSSKIPIPLSPKCLVLNPSAKDNLPQSGNSSNTNSGNSLGSSCGSTSSVLEKPTPPPIDYEKLISPQEVVDKYPKLVKKSSISTLAVRLAKEAYFGKVHMSYCTFKGIGSCPGLPGKEVKKMKDFLHKLCVPRVVTTSVDFEKIYKSCVESVGQACKSLRKQCLAGESLH